MGVEAKVMLRIDESVLVKFRGRDHRPAKVKGVSADMSKVLVQIEGESCLREFYWPEVFLQRGLVQAAS